MGTLAKPKRTISKYNKNWNHNMYLKNLIRQQVIDKLNFLQSKLAEPHPAFNDFDKLFLQEIEYQVELEVEKGIRKRQEGLKYLRKERHGTSAVWSYPGEDLSPGCQACLDGAGLTHIRSVAECNLNCTFCYYHNQTVRPIDSDHFLLSNRWVTANEIKIAVDKQAKHMEGLAWVYRELFLDWEKHIDVMDYISKAGIHQWIYTNGTVLTEDILKQLRDVGIEELRFDLASTNISNKVLDIMGIAREYMPYLMVESPMYTKYFNQFLKKKDQILGTGIDRINCAELHLRANTREEYKSEGPIYSFKAGYVSPIKSRQLTYDLIHIAEAEKWPITINDCSNELKNYRSYRRGDSSPYFYFGASEWETEEWDGWLGPDWYYHAVDNYPMPFKDAIISKSTSAEAYNFLMDQD